MKKALLLTTFAILSMFTLLKAQNVFNPNDRVRRWVNNGSTYSNDSTAATANPNPTILGLQKWVSVKTSGIDSASWGKDYKPYFINVNGFGVTFRLKFPYSYGNPDSAGKKYPVMLFFHGAGEPGCPTNGGIYNNEKQLVHGGQTFRNRVATNQFDGFLLYPQAQEATTSCWSDWGVAPYSPYYNVIINLLDSMSKYARLDVDRVILDGLSNGGNAVWTMTAVYPQRVTKSAPAASAGAGLNFADYVHIPMWFATGGKDTNPTPGYAGNTFNQLKAAGADIRYTLYPDLGHSVWNNLWAEPDFVPFMNDMHKANPLVYFQRYDFCPDSVINTKIGITAGFYAYEWQKDGVTIATRTNGVNTVIDGSSIITYAGNDITVKSFGTYRVRFKRSATADWSLWSPKPAVIYPKTFTVTPPIAVVGTRSKVLPGEDGSTTVPLSLPAGYFSYQWVRILDNVIVSTSNTYNAPVGQYKAKIVEQFGCGSNFSPIFNVVSKSGSPKPDAAKNLSAFTASVSSIQLDWNENPNAGQNETGFEVYRSTFASGPYQLITITAPDVVSYLDQSLASNTKYYYIIRAVGDFGAAEPSNEASALTGEDIAAPSAPSALTVTCASRTNVSLQWTASTDNIGVAAYDIYINGAKAYTTTKTYFAINDLTALSTYTFAVKARDAVGNASQLSNQVVANTILQGLCYQYYLNPPNLAEVPNYNAFVPVARGIAPAVAFTAGGAGVDNFGYLWEGYVNIKVAGNYRFRTCSDDGSRLYLNTPYNDNATPIVNNDGLHGNQCINSATINLAVGVYPIAATFFENGGGEAMTLNIAYSATGTPSTYAAMPTANATFLETNPFVPGGTAPSDPSRVSAISTGADRINITWADNSNNETGFEVARATSVSGNYNPIVTLAAGVTSYLDTNLVASTNYYYKVRAIGSYGQSGYASSEVNWKLNNSYTDAMGTANRILAGAGGTANPTFNAADKKEGSHSLTFDGVNDLVNVTNSTSGGFPSDGLYSARTVSVWIKPTLTTAKYMIFDFGGSDNGIALRTNGNALQAGIASASVRTSVSLASFASNSNWIANGWNLVTVAYNKNTFSLFLNNVQVATTTTSFSSIAAISTSNSVIGYASTATGNAFFDNQNTYAFYAGGMDEIVIHTELTSAADVATQVALTRGVSMDTTLAAPSLPAVPSALTTTVVAKDIIKLDWADNSNDETGFEVWRSVGNQTTFRLLKTVSGGSGAVKSFSDSSLFANITYYYRVRAVGAGGNTAYTNTASATTLNTAPTMTHILDFTMKYATTYALPINAVDGDGDILTFSFDDLPSFATLESVSNGNTNVVLSPTVGDQGVYSITAYVDDGHNGRDTTTFTMVVNDNTVPTMDTITDKILNEGATLVVPVRANDAEGNSYMVWTFDSKPSFATFVDSGNGRGAIVLKPGYATSGLYQMSVFADDGNGAWTSRTFKILVNEVDPNDNIRVNMKQFAGNVPNWNDVDLWSLPNPFNRPALVSSKGVTTTIGLNIVSGSYGASSDGVQTGNNSGLFPDNIMKDAINWGKFATGAADTVRMRVYGLDTARKYNFVFFSSSTDNCCGINANSVTTFRIGNDVAQVNYYLNSSMTDTIYQVKPNAAGEALITMIGDASSNAGGMLNALIINAAFDDGTAPAKPLDLEASFIENQGVRLSWIDRAYNEFKYSVYRATSKNGTYTLVNPQGQNSDSTGYSDLTVDQYTSYFYYVVGVNNYGFGTSSDTVNIRTGNNKPVFSGVSDFAVKADNSFQELFSVSDVAADNVTVSIDNKPSFIVLDSLGNGNYRITATPTIDNLGQKFLVLTARDNKGGVTKAQIIVTVVDKALTRQVSVNFGDNNKTAPAPWNNFLHYGNAGNIINNLRDALGNTTTMSMQMVEGWSARFNEGHITGNNSGVVTDSVLQSGIYYDGTTARTITVAGLDPTKRYNFVIIGSKNEGYNATMRVSVGAVADTLNSRNNTNMTANINGLTPPANGTLTISLIKLTGSNYLYLNGIIIEEYDPVGFTIMNPINLDVNPIDRTSALLTWSDRSNNENTAIGDGFQLQRATDSLFTVNVTNINVWANNSTYTNTGLTANTKYWYRIRAKTSGGVFSAWSNAVKTITPQSMIYVNFNQNVQSVGSPWNNLAAFPDENVVYSNLQNQSNTNTGYTLSITRGWNGENNAGFVTGNSTGMPNNVLQSGYWMDNLQQSQMKISGLNQTKRYRIGYISSSNWIGGELTSTLTVNGRTVYINGWQNSSKIVYIGNLVPDANGELTLDFSTTETSANAYSSGIILEAYDDVNGGAVLNSAVQNPLVKNVVKEESAPAIILSENANIGAVIYPNPFVEDITIDFKNSVSGKEAQVDLYDISGRKVMSKSYSGLQDGVQTLRLSTSDSKLAPGIYMVTLTIDGKLSGVNKLVKTKK